MKTGRSSYFKTLFHCTWIRWLAAAGAACILNLLLFAMMPHLLHSAPTKPAYGQIINQVNVIRVKRPEKQVACKQPREPEPEKPKPVHRPPPQHKLQVAAKLHLPFDINPRLPSGPNTLALPPVETAVCQGPPGQNVFSVGQLDAPLAVIARMPPIYPIMAKRRGIQGWVRVKFMVDEQGHVSRVKILEAKPPGIFEQSVTRCVSAWRFKPPTVEGIAVKTWVATKVKFELK